MPIEAFCASNVTACYSLSVQAEEMTAMQKDTLIFGCSVLLISGSAIAQQHSMPSGKMTDEDIIKSAMSAAPEAIAKGATIIDAGADGKIRVVRQGTRAYLKIA